MRTREEIEEANKCEIGFGTGKNIKATYTSPAQTLILEVLLDCRDELIKMNKNGNI